MSGRDEINLHVKTIDTGIYDEVKLYFLDAARVICHDNPVPIEELERFWGVIVDKYEGRAYHNLEHVKHCIDVSNGVFLDNPMFRGAGNGHTEFGTACMNMAFIYHDVEIGTNHPEEASRDLFFYHFSPYLEDEQGTKWMIADHIMITKHQNFEEEREHNHFGPRRRDMYAENSIWVKDADLAILGIQDTEKYVEYWMGIAREYLGERFNDFEQLLPFYEGRVEWLKEMLKSPRIYKTRAFGLKYEWYARENIIEEIIVHEHMLRRGNR